MNGLSIFYIFSIFLGASIITWFAGIVLAKTTDSLDYRFKIGDALGGLILLGIAGTLPEIAVVGNAARHGDIPVIIGNLIGGISIQTLVIIIFDFAVRGKRPLSRLAGTVVLSLETIFAIAITVLALLAIFIPAKYSVLNVNPLSFIIVIAWIVGLYLINKFRKNVKYNQVASDADPGRKHHERRRVESHKFYVGKSNVFVAILFLIAAIVTLIAGVFLEETGVVIASHFGISSGIFAATVIALVTSLPEISTGLESIFIGDNQLAISDIIGGNAFMLVLFLFTDIIIGKPVLSLAQMSDAVMAFFGILMMSVYAVTFVRRVKRRYLRLGIDSIFVLLLYILGMIVIVYLK